MNPYLRWQVSTELLRLKALPPDFIDSPYVPLFDEFVQQHEFGLALTTICDWIDDTGIAPEAETIAIIDSLRPLMEMDDPIIFTILKLGS